ncbi:MAG: hypothetical protein HOQ29_10235 [Acidobacteria bacterium]|nr:hypothetical protein [Acidobacteriota bacterium]
MTSRLFVACLLAAVPLAAQQEQERPKVPSDSVEVAITGCLNKRVLVADDVRQTDVQSGPMVRNHAFRLQGKKDFVEVVKKNDKQRVEVTGLIKKSALMEPGVRFRGGRVVVGGGTSGMSPAPTQAPDPAQNVPVLDMSSIQLIGGSCGR